MTLEWRARHSAVGFDNWLFDVGSGGVRLVGEVVQYSDGAAGVLYSGFVLQELLGRFDTVEAAQAAVEGAYRCRPVPPREVARRRRPT